MKTSIIIATYNRAHLLPRTIESVLAQTETEWELIIVDDGSTDGTARMLTHYEDPRIIVRRMEQNRGAFAARNLGLSLVTGDYLLVWDSDDVLHPDALARLAATLRERPDVDILYAPVILMRNGKEERVVERSSGPVSYEELISGALPSNDELAFVRRDIIKDVRFAGPNIDYTFYRRLAKRARIYHLNERLGTKHNVTAETDETRARRIPSVARSIARADGIAEMLEEIGDDMRRVNPEGYAGNCYGAALGFLLAGQRTRGRAYVRMAYRASPSMRYLLVMFVSLVPFVTPILRVAYGLAARRNARIARNIYG